MQPESGSRSASRPASSAPVAPWWVRPGLDIEDGRLRIVGRDAEALAREHGTPLFVYDRTRFAENARRLQAALAATGRPFRVRFALSGDMAFRLSYGSDPNVTLAVGGLNPHFTPPPGFPR